MSAEPTSLRDQVRAAIASQTQRTVTVLSSLLAVEDGIGYIPPEAVEEVAESTGSTINDVWAVASFYTNFRFVPPGQHVVEVCWGPSCHLRGAHDLLNEVQMVLGLSQEGDTSDGRVTLKYNTCLGACAQAPVMAVDHKTVGRVTPEQARSIESRLQPGA